MKNEKSYLSFKFLMVLFLTLSIMFAPTSIYFKNILDVYVDFEILKIYISLFLSSSSLFFFLYFAPKSYIILKKDK